jgi:hypothetical protein
MLGFSLFGVDIGCLEVYAHLELRCEFDCPQADHFVIACVGRHEAATEILVQARNPEADSTPLDLPVKLAPFDGSLHMNAAKIK